MTLPHFIIIGAAKSGTTTLYKYLSQHPQIYLPQIKEPSFFAKRYHKGVDWYESLFAEAKTGQLCGEASTPYTHWLSHKPEIPQLMAELLPQVKLIYIMRNPIDRAYSQYLQQVKVWMGNHRRLSSNFLKREQIKERLLDRALTEQEVDEYIETLSQPFKIPETFEELINRGSEVTTKSDYMEKVDVIHASKYIEHIKLYQQYFPAKQFLFLWFDDLKNNPQKLLQQIYDFLEIDSNLVPVNQKAIVANNSQDFFQSYNRRKTLNLIKRLPVIKNVANAVPDSFYKWTSKRLNKLLANQKNDQKYIPQKILPETKIRLIKEFQTSNDSLADFLHVDLSAWNQ